jgi:uncharacterized membrane protein
MTPWRDELAAAGGQLSLDHNDLHPWKRLPRCFLRRRRLSITEVTQESGIDDPLPVMQDGERTSRQQARAGGYAVFLKLAQFLEIMLYVLVAGVMWGTWLSLGRTMTQYDAATFLADGKHMIANLGTAMAVLLIAAIVAGLLVVITLFRYRSTTAAWLALAGLLLVVAVLAVTLSVEVPIDNKINGWSATTLPPDWRHIRARWAAFHTLRTFLSLGAVAAAVGAALTAPARRVPA